ncbi:MAG: ABC transporter ATP-binding protein [Cellulosilyticum sp.]|nr:ABC transporter ATP-binding protein [Cellulosilyticum sp.]
MSTFCINLKRTFSFLKGHYLKYSAGIVGMTAMRCTAALLQAYLLQVVLNVGEKKDIEFIARIFVMLIGYVVIIMLLLPIFQFWFNGQAKYGHGAVNKAIYKKYGDLPVTFFEKNQSGKMLSLLLNDTWLIAAIFMRHFRRVAAAIITIIIYAIPMFILDYRITSLLIGMSILSLLVNVKVAKHMKSQTKEIQRKTAEMTSIMCNLISGMSVIRVYEMQKQMFSQIKNSNQGIMEQEQKRSRMVCMLNVYQYSIYMLNTMLFLFVGSIFVEQGSSSFASILAIMSLQVALDANFKELGDYAPQLVNGLAATERVYEFLESDEEKEKYDMKPVEDATYIDFRNISFSYNEAKELLFDRLNLQIHKGERVALVGESGCGKSTIAKLLLGLYEVKDGGIAIANQNVVDMTVSNMREHIAYVPQESELFHISIRENIRYGNLKATDEEVERAAKKANAYDFIQKLPEGWDTIVGEQGDNLSGGQRQRIAIARAFVKEAPIIVFDEATAALDNETERMVNESIQESQDQTMIVIAHRKSALKYVDRVINL